MHQDEITALFDQQAAGYDARWAKTAPIRECLHLLLGSLLADRPAEARVLCVGAGTGAEIAFLAGKFPRWRFTAVEPSGAMLDVCRQRAEREGFASRCDFHEGFLESLPATEPFDAATCFLVSQFLLERSARVAFFREIARRLKPGGLLASSDLAADVGSSDYDTLLRAWMSMMTGAEVPPADRDRMRQAYGRDVAILPPAEAASIVAAGGFEAPVPFFQAGLIHGWLSKVPHA